LVVLALSIAPLIIPFRRIGAQAAVTAPREWRAWAFGRLGVGRGGAAEPNLFRQDDARLGSLAAGVAASYGAMLGMVRVTDTETFSFSDSPHNGVQDYAVLAGVRSRDDRLFVAGAAGLAQATPIGTDNGLERRVAPTFDLSAHADYGLAGLALTLSGTLGPADTRYFALSFGAELGWFGF